MVQYIKRGFLLQLCYIAVLASSGSSESFSDVEEQCRNSSSTSRFPVCASDVRTYDSVEHVKCVNRISLNANLHVVYQGRCDDPCWLTVTNLTESPVCGSNGFTYPNEWSLTCAHNHRRHGCLLPTTDTPPFCPGGDPPPIHLVQNTACSPINPVNPCKMSKFTPANEVCGSDNVTYFNIWNLRCAEQVYKVDIPLESFGKCPLTCPYSRFYNPVCGTYGVTYANKEILHCLQAQHPYSNYTLLHEGACANAPELSSCDTPSETGLLPTVGGPWRPSEYCASNGVTYKSLKEIRCLKKANKDAADLTVLHHGICTEEDIRVHMTMDQACFTASTHQVGDPVCGSDGKNYSNVYQLVCKSQQNSGLHVSSAEDCGQDSADICELQLQDTSKQQVCGIDGITYANRAALDCENREKPYIKLIRFGECEPMDDPCVAERYTSDMLSPICASTNVTYASLEALLCAMKSDSSLDVKHDGVCI